jgi:hypothetical protein
MCCSPELVAFERGKAKRLLELVEPPLSGFVRQQVSSAFSAALESSQRLRDAHCDPALGVGPGAVPVTHPAHILHALHRELGWRGCPTDSQWPVKWAGYACTPLSVQLPVPSDAGPDAVVEPRSALVVGWGVPACLPPYCVGDAVEGMVAVLECPPGSPDLVRTSWCGYEDGTCQSLASWLCVLLESVVVGRSLHAAMLSTAPPCMCCL